MVGPRVLRASSTLPQTKFVNTRLFSATERSEWFAGVVLSIKTSFLLGERKKEEVFRIWKPRYLFCWHLREDHKVRQLQCVWSLFVSKSCHKFLGYSIGGPSKLFHLSEIELSFVKTFFNKVAAELIISPDYLMKPVFFLLSSIVRFDFFSFVIFFPFPKSSRFWGSFSHTNSLW